MTIKFNFMTSNKGNSLVIFVDYIVEFLNRSIIMDKLLRLFKDFLYSFIFSSLISIVMNVNNFCLSTLSTNN